MFMPVREFMTAAPPSRSMEVTRMLVKMQKKKNVMCAGLPQRASAQERCMSAVLHVPAMLCSAPGPSQRFGMHSRH